MTGAPLALSSTIETAREVATVPTVAALSMNQVASQRPSGRRLGAASLERPVGPIAMRHRLIDLPHKGIRGKPRPGLPETLAAQPSRRGSYSSSSGRATIRSGVLPKRAASEERQERASYLRKRGTTIGLNVDTGLVRLLGVTLVASPRLLERHYGGDDPHTDESHSPGADEPSGVLPAREAGTGSHSI